MKKSDSLKKPTGNDQPDPSPWDETPVDPAVEQPKPEVKNRQMKKSKEEAIEELKAELNDDLKSAEWELEDALIKIKDAEQELKQLKMYMDIMAATM